MTPILRILHLEDEPADAELVRSRLEAEGLALDVTCVQTAADFRAALQRGAFDLIFSDYSLPSYDGLSALAAARQACPEVPFLFVSGTIGEDTAIESLKNGATDYVLKQRLSRLGAAVRRALREAGDRRERRKAEQALRDSEERYRGIVEDQTELICRFRPDCTLIFVNSAYARYFGRRPQDMVGVNFLEQVVPEDRAPARAYIESLVAGAAPRVYEHRVIHPTGEVRWQEWNNRVIRNGDGHAVELQSVGRDITERKRAEEMIRHLAYHDRLTDLPNRARLEERLTEAIADAQQAGGPLACLLLNLDRFVEVNSTLGHQNGDLVLREVAQRVRQATQDGEMAARLAGSEFAVMAPGADAERAAHVARALLQALETPFLVAGLPIQVEASVGIALFPAHGERPDALIQRAGVAVAAAKKAGSDHAVYDSQHDPFSPRRLTLMGELRAAIEGSQLFLEYQPQVQFATGRIVGVEALVRWQHPKLGLVPPAQFVPLAEPSGLIRPLTHWVLKEALRQLDGWRRAGMALPVSVNLSARNLQDPGLYQQIAELLDTWHVPWGWLNVEITESAIMADARGAVEVLDRLRASGLSLAVDDFGTGYSSLAYLRELPISTVKIDRAFVRDMAANEKDAAIVGATLQLAHSLGLTVVAEGVEDERTWNLLRLLGCDAAQGYYLAKPMPPSHVPAWIKASGFSPAREKQGRQGIRDRRGRGQGHVRPP